MRWFKKNNTIADHHTVSDSPALRPDKREDDLRHMLRRAGMGVSHNELRNIRSKGWRYWLEDQLNHEGIPDPVGDSIDGMFPRVFWDAPKVWQEVNAGRLPQFDWERMFELGMWTVGKYCWSSRRLFENMVDFWNNHLNVTCPSGDVWDSRGDYDMVVIRRHALGSFGDLLVASFKHPAMLEYIDNADSTKDKPNENYARELMELHTVGVGNHTEHDVLALAKLLTGWELPYRTGAARFVANRHDGGAQTILGHSVPAHNPADGWTHQERFLRWLAVQPATARFVCRKLAVKFVSDDPPAELVNYLADGWVASDGDIKTVLRRLFSSPEFWNSKRQKLRRPLEDIAATVLALGLERPQQAEGLKQLYWLMGPTGHQPLRWSLPDGYPDTAKDWTAAGSQLTMWNIHVLLAGGAHPTALGLPKPQDRLPDPKPRTPRDLVNHTTAHLAMEPLPGQVADAIMRRTKVDFDTPFNSWDPHINGLYAVVLALALDSPPFRVR